MDFDLTEQQSALYRSTLDFAKKKLNGSASGEIGVKGFSLDKWKRCADQGMMSMIVPEAYGGLGLGALDSAFIMEALACGCRDTGTIFSVAAHIYACIVPVLKFGSDELKERYLPGLASGETMGTHSITEPEAGSNALEMKARAVRDGDDYVLNGSKSFASNAPFADLFIIHAMTHPDAGFMGLSAFVVEKGNPGLSVSTPYKKIGLESAPLGDVFLDNCRIPASNRIGMEGHGGMVFTHSMNWERACLFALYVGSMQRQLEESVAYAKSRKQFQVPIRSFQGVNHKIVDMKVRLEASRLLVYQAAWKLDHDGAVMPSAQSSIAKLFTSEAAVQSSLDAIQVHGGLGIMREGEVECYLRDAVPSRIFSGTSEIQKNTIAKSLGL